VGRLIRNIKKAPTPQWLLDRLASSDINGIHPVVDILNYVMLELGQPMHAFDADKLKGTVVVRMARPEEPIITLDAQTVTLAKDVLVIADQNKAQAIAGIIGGNDSAVGDNTTQVFLESALFTPELLAGKARRFGLHTDSSFRFERGVDPALQKEAIERATQLIVQICGGEPGPVQEQVNTDSLPKRDPIAFRYARVERILGDKIPESKVYEILQGLGCNVSNKTSIVPPSFRYDLAIETDLIEEIARVIGYNNLSNQMPVTHLAFVKSSQNQVSTSRVKRALVDQGYQEVITYSFVDEAMQKLLFPDQNALALANPISENMNVMRVSLWPGLLTALRYNQNRQQDRLKIFEVGLRFDNSDPKHLIQEKMLSGLLFGSAAPLQWGMPSRSVDFFDAKHTIESLWQLLGHKKTLTFTPFPNSACHPGQCAQITWEGEILGVVGRLHPALEKKLDLQGPIYLFELNYEYFNKATNAVFQAPSRFPAIRRDLALLVDNHLPSDNLIECVRKSAPDVLRDVGIFDVYTGKGVEPGKKSIALGLILQHPSRTLVDEEVNNIIQTVVNNLEKDCSAKLRE
jgi:phenylalanyl-tRNA synthetase beta chain